MPLPQQVVEQLGRGPTPAPRGGSWGALLFCGGMIALVVVLYVVLQFGFQPVLNAQISSLQNQVAQANSSISTSQETQLIDFYSQITNLQTVLAGHVYTSSFLAWLAANTEANIYYQDLELTSDGRVTLTGNAASESDINEQVAIFENSPEVSDVVVTSIAAPTTGTGLSFKVSLVVAPSVFNAVVPGSPATTASAQTSTVSTTTTP